ncbi:MAG TPA: PLP-dependent aminotransferase family protein [Patescibacteria group bacterium]|nr:PLP-dependent aminotransferase family protein [Patescibacteria group bacterium]
MDLKLTLDHTRPTPLYRQIYEQIRQRILAGEYPAGARLPSSRMAAQRNGLARVTMTKAYDQLEAEGYLISRIGSGTFVSQALMASQTLTGSGDDRYRPTFSLWGQRVLAGERRVSQPGGRGRPAIDFGFGRSFPHIFPYDTWRRLLVRYLSTDDSILSRYGSVAGFFPLREAVAEYVRRLRGVLCTAEQVVIVSGMQQALDILARLLLSSGDEILVETPGYVDAFDLFRASGAELSAIPVDEEGFPVEEISPDSRARFAFVTPSNQFPRGGTMPLSRRMALLQWARQANALILEDDYDGELRYSEHPLAALQGLDKDGRVVYLGTFSKVLFPALRLGYVVLPHVLLGPFVKAMELVDRGAPTLTQAAVTDFITEGHFESHLRRLRKEYGERRRVLVQALEQDLAGVVHYSHVEAGLHVMLLLDPRLDEEAVVLEAASAGVGVYPGTAYHVGLPQCPSILLGYSGLGRTEIEQGVGRLAVVLKGMTG